MDYRNEYEDFLVNYRFEINKILEKAGNFFVLFKFVRNSHVIHSFSGNLSNESQYSADICDIEIIQDSHFTPSPQDTTFRPEECTNFSEHRLFSLSL